LIVRSGYPPRKERERDENHALTLLQEATATKVGAITASLRNYEEQIAAGFRAQVTKSTTRLRVAEREAEEAGSVLVAASGLVREQRALLDDLGALPALVAELRTLRGGAEGPLVSPSSAARIVTSEADPDARATVEMAKPAASCPPLGRVDDEEPEEELTTVAARPPPGTSAAPNGLRLAPRPVPRPAIRPPPPPASADEGGER
jgi:hypothetical protein